MTKPYQHPAIFNLGFRPFFTGASLFAIISIAYWLFIYSSMNGFIAINPNINFVKVSPFQWHAHEMIYGYSLAVIAGFLLTAVKNWTGIQTIHGFPLAVLFSCWFIARMLWLAVDSLLAIAAVFDLLFLIGLIYFVANPIIIKKQWKQMAILSKLFLLGFANLAFYLDAFSLFENGIHIGLYGGLYLIIGLILTIGRRIIPLFVQNALPYKVTLFNAKWLDMSSLVGVLGFFITEVFMDQPFASLLFASLMFVVTTIRIIGWYTPGIWKNPLLWSFYVALFFIDLGFLLFVIAFFLDISPFLSIHSFAYGAIGVITMSMIARVSTGHTGRSLKQLPKSLFIALFILSVGALIRVFCPLLFPDLYSSWVLLSGILWICAFSLFSFIFIKYWVRPRVDHKYG